MDSQSPIPSIDVDNLVDLPDINANVIAIVMLQYDIPSETVKKAILDMLRQAWTLRFRYDIKPSPFRDLPQGKTVSSAYDSPLDKVIDKSVRYEVSSIDPATILAEHPSISRGDVVHLRGEDNYRNTGCSLWDGAKTVSLYTEIDDYGSLPPSITLNEFPEPDYFNNSIDHNYVRWLRFNKNQITVFSPGKFFVVSIETVDGQIYEYNIDISKQGRPFGDQTYRYHRYRTAGELYENLSIPLAVSETGDGVLKLIGYEMRTA